MAKVVVLNLKAKKVKDKLKLLRNKRKSLDGSAVLVPKKEQGVASPLPLEKEKGVVSPLLCAAVSCGDGVSVMTPPGKKQAVSSSPLIHKKMDIMTMTAVGDASEHGKISSQNGKECTSASLQLKEPQPMSPSLSSGPGDAYLPSSHMKKGVALKKKISFTTASASQDALRDVAATLCDLQKPQPFQTNASSSSNKKSSMMSRSGAVPMTPPARTKLLLKRKAPSSSLYDNEEKDNGSKEEEPPTAIPRPPIKHPSILLQELPKTAISHCFPHKTTTTHTIGNSSTLQSTHETQRLNLILQHRAQHEYIRKKVLTCANQVVVMYRKSMKNASRVDRMKSACNYLEEELLIHMDMLNDTLQRQSMEISALSGKQTLECCALARESKTCALSLPFRMQVLFPFPEVFDQARNAVVQHLSE